ncbi:MAG: helix-turn-helix domain-containing protein [Cyclobacteriaceae bacterium]|nr:helix-turn-helix domain-containing protein [Cyclobacteriaceae bacterium]
MESHVHTLYKSTHYQIRNYQCGCTECSISKKEHAQDFCIIFVRSGFYEQRVFRQQNEMHVGRVLVSKPEIEFTIRHVHNQPDLCTSFRFNSSFYGQVVEKFSKEGKWFFTNPDLQSLLLSSNATLEFMHQQILLAIGNRSALEIDTIVISLLENVMHRMSNGNALKPIPESLRKHHLSTVEKAKDFLLHNFTKEVSLSTLADHCCVSMFHLSRIFKSILTISPHQYLTELRLSHARLLLRSTNVQITQVAFQSGFNSLEHFVTTYRQRFGGSPSSERDGNRLTIKIANETKFFTHGA